MAGAGDAVRIVQEGYAFGGAECLEIGALLVDGKPVPDAPVRVPLAMLNRHGLVAGATGTGKTKTLQVLAEQLSAAGVSVFAADVKGDLSGMAAAAEPSEKIATRAASVGQAWQPTAYPVEFFALGGLGNGVPVRASISSFGPTLLSKVLGLNDTQESSLGLVFHFADQHGLPLLDVADLRAVLHYLISDEGKAELEGLGALSKATAGVILRELIAFEGQGADVFFGEPEFEVEDFMLVTDDGQGVVSMLELPSVQDRPALFSSFVMWLLAELYEALPEVGDLDKPKLVFFFDEAHLLFKDASKDFLSSVVQTVRLIRSKGVGVFFVTQTPKDVHGDVLAQLGSRIQHQLRAFTPDDDKALKATARTFPKSGYDMEELLTTLGIGEAVVTVQSERGTPTPVAPTMLRAPQSLMAPIPEEAMVAAVQASPLSATYGERVDRESAREMLAARLAGASDAAGAPAASGGAAGGVAGTVGAEDAEARAIEESILGRSSSPAIDDLLSAEPAPAPSRSRKRSTGSRSRARSGDASGPATKGGLEGLLVSAGTAIGVEIVRGMFGTGRRRRR